jgi:5'-nucleotidase
MDKGEFLSSFNADIFFDDQHKNIEEASDKVAAGHVLYGVKNK